MQNNNFKILNQFLGGIFGGTLLGILGWTSLMTYGGNYGCFAWIDSLMGSVGYESCGSFGSMAGILIGVFLGIIILRILKIHKPQRTALFLILLSFLIPFLIGSILLWPEKNLFFLVFPPIFAFIAASFIVSSVLTPIINWKEFFSTK